jgi:hypothetical protein
MTIRDAVVKYGLPLRKALMSATRAWLTSQIHRSSSNELIFALKREFALHSGKN